MLDCGYHEFPEQFSLNVIRSANVNSYCEWYAGTETMKQTSTEYDE